MRPPFVRGPSGALAWLIPCCGLSFATLVGCGDDAEQASGSDTQQVWSAWTVEAEAIDIGVDEGLLAGRGAESVGDRPTQTRDGHPIDVEPDGSLSYVPPPDFWGATSFDYALDGRSHTGYIAVAPTKRAISWTSVSNRQLLTGWRSGDGFGASLVNAGDMDGDGDDELVVAAPRANASLGPQRDEGAVVIVPGRSDGTFSQGGNWLYGSEPFMQLGQRVCAPGDQDGDGLADLWVMGYGELPDDGAPSLHLLNGRGDLTAFAGAAFDDVAGRALTHLPFSPFDAIVCGVDLMGNDAPDLVFTDGYRVWILDGATAGQRAFAEAAAAGDLVDITANWPELAAEHGYVQDFQRVTDLDGDGLHDVAIVVRDYERVAGVSVDLLGSNSSSVRTLVRAQESARSVAVGDFDGDGTHDVAIGDRDGVWVFLDVDAGEHGPVADVHIASDLEGDTPILQAQDIDGDGTDDLIASRPFAEDYDEQWYGRGAVTVLFGGMTFAPGVRDATTGQDGRTGFTLFGADNYRSFANAGVAIGDFDGDRVPDLAVSAPNQSFEQDGEPEDEVGAALIIRGFGPPRD